MVTAAIDDANVQTPISVYFGLEQGRVADLEAVAEASLAWSSAIKSMLAELEPGLTVEIQIVDGEKGSLWLNTLLTFLESKMEQIARGAERFPRLAALARGLAIIVVATPLQLTAEDIWKAVLHEQPEAASLSQASQDQLKAMFDKAIRDGLAEAQRDKFAGAVSKDDKITAVGVSATTNAPPKLLVQRDQIGSYLQREQVSEDGESTRRRITIMHVTLVSPVLEDTERSWRFRQPGLPEFGAVMKDRGFLAAMASRAVHEELRFGIPMEIEVEFKEKFEGGIWVPVERNVLRVIQPTVDRNELPL